MFDIVRLLLREHCRMEIVMQIEESTLPDHDEREEKLLSALSFDELAARRREREAKSINQPVSSQLAQAPSQAKEEATKTPKC